MSTFESLPFYRGVSAQYQIDRASILRPRLDRRPRNSPIAFHEIADRWFKKRFGIAYRSQGLFVTSRLMTASTYAETPAHVMRIIPLSIYKYCWSPKVSDLLFAANRFASAPEEEIIQYLDSAQYCEIGLDEANNAGHEVMLRCERYIAIPVGLLEMPTDSADSRSIILLN